MDFILFPPTGNDSSISHSDAADLGEKMKTEKLLSRLGNAVVPLALWGQVHGLLFLSPVQGVYERVQASAGRENGQSLC